MVEIGSDPGKDRGAAEMAGLLDLSRESVHQLLAPYVRTGLLVAVRGRTGGYRAGAGLLGSTLSEVLVPFGGAAPRDGEATRRLPLQRLVDEVEAESVAARLAVYDRLTVGDLVARLRAERQAISFEI